jgi:hypothetical protein
MGNRFVHRHVSERWASAASATKNLSMTTIECCGLTTGKKVRHPVDGNNFRQGTILGALIVLGALTVGWMRLLAQGQPGPLKKSFSIQRINGARVSA